MEMGPWFHTCTVQYATLHVPKYLFCVEHPRFHECQTFPHVMHNGRKRSNVPVAKVEFTVNRPCFKSPGIRLKLTTDYRCCFICRFFRVKLIRNAFYIGIVVTLGYFMISIHEYEVSSDSVNKNNIWLGEYCFETADVTIMPPNNVR